MRAGTGITTTIMARMIEVLEQRGTKDELVPPAASTADAGGEGLPSVALLAWLSPSFPVGSFAFSHGIEWAVEAHDVKDLESVVSWIGSLIEQGGCRNDAILLAHAWRAVRNDDLNGLAAANEFAIALAGSRERRLETTAQGNAFMSAVASAWDAPGIARTREALLGDVAYPAAVAIAAAAHDVPLAATTQAFCLAAVQNLISASIRLNAIGQTDGQRAIAALLPKTQDLAQQAQSASLDDLGGATFRSDISALRHETQYTRLFRS